MEERLNERYNENNYNLMTDDYFTRSTFSDLTFRYVKERDTIVGTVARTGLSGALIGKRKGCHHW